MNRPRRTIGFGDTALIAILAALVLVPAVALFADRPPSRFGFQMYSGYGALTARWTDTAGQTQYVPLLDHVASPRRDIDWTTFLPERLCERIGGAVSVEVTQVDRGGDRIGTARC